MITVKVLSCWLDKDDLRRVRADAKKAGITKVQFEDGGDYYSYLIYTGPEAAVKAYIEAHYQIFGSKRLTFDELFVQDELCMEIL